MEKSPGHILIIDDDPDVLQTARFILRQHFDKVHGEKEPRKIPYLLSQHSFDVVLLDMNYKPGHTSGEEGLGWLKKIKELNDQVSLVVITAYGEVGLAVEAMKNGATDFIVKPWENEKFVATINSAYQLSKSRKEIDNLKAINKRMVQVSSGDRVSMVGESASLSNVIEMIDKVAPTDANVLILGENGTGKELVARMIHEHSERSSRPFVKVDLGSLSSSIFESELFGHVKGAFTDARENRPGRFEIASGGTLFLDEIGNIDLSLQSKLLSAIQNREIFPVGSSKVIPVDIRLICATNTNPGLLVNEGKFREDLYYRLNTFEITVPPLRDRKEDIEELVTHFLDTLGKRYKKSLKITSQELKKLQNYNWPGNIRELEHTIERAVIMTNGPSLGLENIAIGNSGQDLWNSNLDDQDNLDNLDNLERSAIEKALTKYKGNMTRIAKELGVGRTTLYRKIKKYGL
jgi:DNA-binding NtrC family response regulator